MFRRLTTILFATLSLFWLSGCYGSTKAKDPALATHEANFNATATALVAQVNGTPTWAVPDAVLTVRAELDKVPDSKKEELLSGPDAFPVKSKGMGYAGYSDPREIFSDPHGKEYGCQDPWLPSPTKCIRYSEHCLLCNGQILCDCPPGGCIVIHTATPVVATATTKPEDHIKVVTATTKPEEPIKVVTATTKPEEPIKIVTATPVPPFTSQPPKGTETCEPTPVAKPCDDEVLDFNKREQLPRDKFGTILQTAPNGKHLPLGGQDMVVREEVRMCQIHVVNAWKIHDRITGISKTGCVVGYRRGIAGDDSYHEVNYVASDGYGFHIESRNAGFGLQEGVSQMVLALESARKDDGTYACKRAGDQSSERRNAQEIQFMELGLRGP